ncbi:three-helix bundle dimerization domain-containing protein [Dissulfurispira sp.]|uniref:three-helix bundle dimerization domain-containing protein n=1 Tax=Dissulfurispira sp. TaxID=2817609 RepID=UPI002FD8A0A1
MPDTSAGHIKSKIGVSETGDALLCNDETEKRLHSNAIEMLTRDLDISADEIRRLYNIVLERLKRDATVKDFLPILVSRRVKYLLNLRRNGKENRTRESK